MVAIDVNPTSENKEKVNQAFEGAAYAFVRPYHKLFLSMKLSMHKIRQ